MPWSSGVERGSAGCRPSGLASTRRADRESHASGVGDLATDWRILDDRAMRIAGVSQPDRNDERAMGARSPIFASGRPDCAVNRRLSPPRLGIRTQGERNLLSPDVVAGCLGEEVG
jgi:hypothetical protein